MKCKIPEISWHNREPVLSVDISPLAVDFYRLATGGSDNLILIWQLKCLDDGDVDIDLLSELTRHQRAVNVVRWSPNGEYLASGDDDSNIILWQLKTDNIPLLEGDDGFKETWIVYKILRGHKEDVYDIAWSPNSLNLLTGSVDNTAILWDVAKAKINHILTDHKSFVQGVAWDPKNEFLATLSSDRICRVFNVGGRKVCSRIGKGTLPVPEGHSLYSKEVKYFHDDTFKTFFRRLNFSPDGSFLVVPSGCVETEDTKTAMYGTYIFTLDSLKQPAAILPASKQCSIVVRCCPIYFELRENGPKPYVDLPYRIVIAIATDSDVILYDTQQTSPFAHFQKIHYTRLTDLTWSADGRLLIASSTDGFITHVTFEPDELGIKYTKEEIEMDMDISMAVADIAGDVKEEKVASEKMAAEKVEQSKVKTSSFLEKWAKKGPKRKDKSAEAKVDVKRFKGDDVIEILDSPLKDNEKKENVVMNKLEPRRIVPIAVGPSVKSTSEMSKSMMETLGPVTGASKSAPETSMSKTNDFKAKFMNGTSEVTSEMSNLTTGTSETCKDTTQALKVKKRIAPIKVGECGDRIKKNGTENALQTNVKLVKRRITPITISECSKKVKKNENITKNELIVEIQQSRKRIQPIKIGECDKMNFNKASCSKMVNEIDLDDESEDIENTSYEDEEEDESENDIEMIENECKKTEKEEESEKSDKHNECLKSDIKNKPKAGNINISEKNTELEKPESNEKQISDDSVKSEKSGESIECAKTKKLINLTENNKESETKNKVATPQLKTDSKQLARELKEVIEKDSQKNETKTTENSTDNYDKTSTPKNKRPAKTASAKKSEEKKRSAKKTPTAVNSKMSLLNFFKPLNDVPKVTETKGEAFKINTTNLFKEIILLDSDEKSVTLDDTCEAPDDFSLRIEESMTDLEDVTEYKENTMSECKEEVSSKLSELKVNPSSQLTTQDSTLRELKDDTSAELKEHATTECKENASSELKENTSLKLIENTLKINSSLHLNENSIPELKDNLSSEVKETKTLKEPATEELKSDKNIEMIKNELKQPRRIPLITLSSPKGKKKRTET